MDSNRWKQVDNLLQAVLERPPGGRDAFLRQAWAGAGGAGSGRASLPVGRPARGRDAFLRQACAGDAALEREVRALLTSQQQAASFLESPAMEVAARALARQQSPDRSNAAPESTDFPIGRAVSHYP